MSAGEERIEVLHVGGQTATEFFLHFFLKVQQGKGMFAWVKSLCVPFTEYLGEHYRSLSDNTHFSPKSLLTWNIAKVKGGRETEDGRGKRQHICLNLTPLLTTLRRLHYGAHHCPASSRQSLFHCANSAPWKDCKNKRWMSKAKVNRISPFFCRAGEVCTNTSLRDREERRALWRKELEGAGRSWSVFAWKGQNREKLPAWLLGLLKTPIRKHLDERPPEYTRHYSEDKTQRMEWWPLDAKNTETAKCFCVQEKRKKTSTQ